MSLKLLSNGLDGVATLSEGETQPIWCKSQQGYFYVEESSNYDLTNFCDGVQLCEIDIDCLIDYFTQGFQILNRYRALFKDEHYERFIKNKEYFERQRKVKFYIANQIGGGNIQSQLKILNKRDSRSFVGLFDECVENGEKLRQSILAGVTNLKFVNKNGYKVLSLIIVDKWGEILMKKSSKVDLEKLVSIFEQEIDNQCQIGKSESESAQIFGIKYEPLINNNEIDVIQLVNNSKYSNNSTKIIDAVKNGMKISPDVIWKTYTFEKKLNLKEEFKAWLKQRINSKGEFWVSGSINNCIGILKKGFDKFNKYEDYDSCYEITELAVFKDYQIYLETQEGVDEFDKSENGWFSKGLQEYSLFLQDYESKNVNDLDKIIYKTQCDDEVSNSKGEKIKVARNRIFFGAPGTGKSYELDKQTNEFVTEGCYERVTFHPEYTYSAFFGAYKPVPNPKDPNKITYAFIPGPFLRVLSKALINANIAVNPQPFVLLIEEINRANMAAVFGEVFQLLDREGDVNSDFTNASKYPISPSEDVKKYLVDEFDKAGVYVIKEDFNELRIPNNMFIWASMNSADQGVFPMDTAFKRRWDFEYFNINGNEDVISSYTFNIAGSDINWNSLRNAINQRLTELRINEDKLMGPFFIGKSVLEGKKDDEIINTIKNKVIMYLFEDAARQKRKDVFIKGYEKTYSQICKDFETKGIEIFTKEIVEFYNENIK